MADDSGKRIVDQSEQSVSDNASQTESRKQQNHLESLSVEASSSGSFVRASTSLLPAKEIPLFHKASTNSLATSIQNLAFTSSSNSIVRKLSNSEPLNLSANINGKKSMVSVPMEIVKKNIAKGILNDVSPKKILVQSPMKIRVSFFFIFFASGVIRPFLRGQCSGFFFKCTGSFSRGL